MGLGRYLALVEIIALEVERQSPPRLASLVDSHHLPLIVVATDALPPAAYATNDHEK